MTELPRDRTLDATFALLREGYAFIGNRCNQLGSDVFETRLLGQPAVCMRGPEAARAFYEHPISRTGGLPPPMFTLLQDKGSVAALDGDAHHHRKQLFLGLLAPPEDGAMVEIAESEWELALTRWARADHVVLLPEVSQVFTRVVCRWAGVPLGEPESYERSRELTAMIDGAGSAGLRNLRGQLLRHRTERWVRSLVDRVRRGTLQPAEDSALATVAAFRDPAGHLLTTEEAAVELINMLRPTVAVARYVAFLALALHHHPEAADAPASSVALEVRRYYPFFPSVGGRVREPFSWRGIDFPAGRRVLLDIYGTNRDRTAWQAPDAFRPHRFDDWAGDPFTLIPQGGGDHAEGHRCPGEWATNDLLAQAHQVLTQRIRYDVPEQDLRVRLSRIPAQPESGLVIRDVERR